MAQDGYGAPYVVATYNGTTIQDLIESFAYTASEDDDDNAEFNIRLEDPKKVDLPQYQEGAVWTVMWGYIKGPKSHIRTVTCYEVKPEFQDQNILITISFHEQGVSLKQRDTKNVYTDTNIVDVLHQTGKIHGLTTNIVVNDANGTPIKVATTDSLVATLKQYAQQQATKDSLDIKLFGSSDSQLQNAIGSEEATVSFPDQLAIRESLENFAMYGNLVQGNKTDKQFLDELGKRQPGGQYILDTTDGEATLKQRDFNQAPIRSYRYGQDDGELISFAPESKGTSKYGSALGLGYDGWDKNNKTYFGDLADPGVDPELSDDAKKTLSKYKKQLANLNDKVDSWVVGHTTAPVSASNPYADATNQKSQIFLPITVLDRKTALGNTIAYFEPTTNNKNFSDPTANYGAAGNHADNVRDEAELKMNPGTINAYGDPTVFKGKIITMLGVGKKYSGNYYITKSVHHISGDKQYHMDLEVVRQGHNIPTNNTYVPVTSLGESTNTEIGPSVSEKWKAPPITYNPIYNPNPH